MMIIRSWMLGMAVALGLISAAVTIGSDETQMTARKLYEAGEILSLEQITSLARQHRPGHVLEVQLELEQERGVHYYEVELVDNEGQVWKLHYDAQSGDLVKDWQRD